MAVHSAFEHKTSFFSIPELSKLGFRDVAVLRHINDLRSQRGFYEELEKRIAEAQKLDPKIGGWVPVELLEIYYALVREMRPEAVIETGIGPGSSSLFILKALDDNGQGMLYSIDLPGGDKLAYESMGKEYNIRTSLEGGIVGWLVPEGLRKRWIVKLGDARLVLPTLLESVHQIDLFIHDSLHTYEHMMFEYQTAWPYLRDSGIMMSDDVDPSWSLAFPDFCKEKRTPLVTIGRVGFTRK